VALAAALVGGALALRLRQSVILGFLLAGLAVGPFTPGFVAPGEVIGAVAEVGIVFLMFAVGVQLSLRELLQVGRVSIVGALAQVTLTIALAGALALAFGFGAIESFVFGAVISNSSSTVLSKILFERGEVETGYGRLALAWSSVQDISTVLLVALFSALSPSADGAHGVLLGKAALFLLGIAPAALWLLPRLFDGPTVLRSREIFILLVATVALGMAWAASLFGVSLALGAFLAGVAVGESPTAHRVLGDAIPLRDIFSGVFFVSIGMSIDPAFVVDHAGLVAATVLLTIAGKGALCAIVALALGCTPRTSLFVAASLAQSADFSFLLANIGRQLGLIDATFYGALLAGAALSILFAPGVTTAARALLPLLQRTWLGTRGAREAPGASLLDGHAIVCGYGRVGGVVAGLLERFAARVVVIDEDPQLIAALRKRRLHALLGDAAQPTVLDRAGVARARVLIICIPERMAVRRIVDHARQANPGLLVLARTHSNPERTRLYQRGVAEVVMGELELALELGRRSRQALGFEPTALEGALESLRRGDAGPNP
jgi:CPA2 family monovalent cation:H+ antiporter-2